MQDEHILREYSGYKLKQQRPGYPHVLFLIVPPAVSTENLRVQAPALSAGHHNLHGVSLKPGALSEEVLNTNSWEKVSQTEEPSGRLFSIRCRISIGV